MAPNYLEVQMITGFNTMYHTKNKKQQKKGPDGAGL
jgi:hypothetical protein